MQGREAMRAPIAQPDGDSTKVTVEDDRLAEQRPDQWSTPNLV
jgi:hypothetical protein